MTLIFIFFALLLFITITPNAIHALLALILLFINFAILLFITETSFLGFAYILVYIGAICVLFLYIILLLHLRSYSLMQRSNALILIGLLIGFISIFSYINYISENLYIDTAAYNVFLLSDLQLFTSYLFVTHQHYMFLGIFLLLLALFLSIFVSTKFLITTNTKLEK
uniref:NADH-ubiquinone oxidoreductase chain 6 n=1 Tax=Didymium iridis TaxID=5793 RepID=D2K6K9_9MYCE|nr:NADH dehydrogenase subunit 6 [Didymium iridis]ACZ96471.1 NADH dehydrogenase subunit 6 [Didymium iridis]